MKHNLNLLFTKNNVFGSMSEVETSSKFTQNTSNLNALGRNANKRQLGSVWLPTRFTDLAGTRLLDRGENSRFVVSQKEGGESFHSKPRKSKILFTISTGLCGMRNARKKQPLAIQPFLSKLNELCSKLNIELMNIETQGHNRNKNRFLKELEKGGLNIKIGKLADKTRAPHNGCRARKKRRL